MNDLLLVLNDAIVILIFFIIVIIIHEAGHWIFFRILGFKVGLKFNIAGDLEIGRSVHNKVNLWNSIYVSLGGILAGILPFYLLKWIFLDAQLYLFLTIIYCFMCFGDLSLIFECLHNKNKNQTLMELNISQWKEYVKDMQDAGEKIDVNGQYGKNI